MPYPLYLPDPRYCSHCRKMAEAYLDISGGQEILRYGVCHKILGRGKTVGRIGDGEKMPANGL